jgi:hypothetical protein
MSEFEPGNTDEIARRLREEGPAQAPADLAGDVMKRVRSEPRRSTSAVRRPLVTLLAASLVAVALVAGIAKLGGGASTSAGGGSSGGDALEALGPTSDNVRAPKVVQSRTLTGVPRAALLHVRMNGIRLSDTPSGKIAGYCSASGDNTFDGLRPYTVDVPFVAWESVQAQLETARKALPAAAPLVSVRLRRLAPGVTTRGAVTCP